MLWKKDKKEKEAKKPDSTPEEFKNVDAAGVQERSDTGSPAVLPKEYGILKGFYISEKATGLAPFSQYVFKVFNSATKNEVKKQVERNFDVKVKGVKIINLPRKSRRVGRHTGFKSGFKKAVVVLEKGYSIEQAKA